MTEINKALRPYFDDYNAEKGFYEILFRPQFACRDRDCCGWDRDWETIAMISSF